MAIEKRSGGFEVTMLGKDSAGAQKTYTIPAYLEMRVQGTPVGGSAAAQDTKASIVLVKGG